jgi:hypothetical protein
MSTLDENNNDNDNDETLITSPLVFYCSKCRTIVGDSFSYLSSDAELKVITLSATSNIQRSADVYTSKSGADVGSTYFSFACVSCQTSLGRYYLTTSKDLDYLREKFSFNVDSISSYTLGNAQHGKIPDPLPDGEFDNNIDMIDKNDEENLKDSIITLNQEIVKIQALFIGLVDRIEKLEQHSNSSNDQNHSKKRMLSR